MLLNSLAATLALWKRKECPTLQAAPRGRVTHNGEMATLHFPQWNCACVAPGQFDATGSSLTDPQRAVSLTCEKTSSYKLQHLSTQHCSQCQVFFPTGFSSADQQQCPDKELLVERDTHWSPSAATWACDSSTYVQIRIVADLRPRPPLIRRDMVKDW